MNNHPSRFHRPWYFSIICVLMACVITAFPLPAAADSSADIPLLYSNFNIYAVQNGPTGAAVYTPEEDVFLQAVTTYHWNSGYGCDPVIISIYTGGGGCLGNWQAVAQTGSTVPENVYWEVFPNVELKAGTAYYIEDSDYSTWSCNAESDNVGFFELRGVPAAAPDTSEDQKEDKKETPENEKKDKEEKSDDDVETVVLEDRGTSTAEADGLTLTFEGDQASKVVLKKTDVPANETVYAGCYTLDVSGLGWDGGGNAEEPDPEQVQYDIVYAGYTHVRLAVTGNVPAGQTPCIAAGIPFTDEDGNELMTWKTVPASVSDGYAEADINLAECTYDFVLGKCSGDAGAEKEVPKALQLTLKGMGQYPSPQRHFLMQIDGQYVSEDGVGGLSADDLTRMLDDLEAIYQYYIDLGYKSVRDLTKNPLVVTVQPLEDDGYYDPSFLGIEYGTMELNLSGDLKNFGYRRPALPQKKKGGFNNGIDLIDEENYRCIAHEMFHYFQNQYVNSSYYKAYMENDWFYEGTAMYYEEVLAKANGIAKSVASLYLQEHKDVYSGIVSMRSYKLGGYARRPLFEYIEEHIGQGKIKETLENWEKNETTVLLEKAMIYGSVTNYIIFSDEEKFVFDMLDPGKTRGELARDFYRTMVTTDQLNSLSSHPWNIYNTKDSDFHNEDKNHPERSYLNTLNVKGSDLTGSGKCQAEFTVYGYGSSFLKIIPENIPGAVTGLCISGNRTTLALTAMTFTENSYDRLKVYISEDSVTIPVNSEKILLMVTDTSGEETNAQITVEPVYGSGYHPTGEEESMPTQYEGTLTYLKAVENKDGNATTPEYLEVTVSAAATLDLTSNAGKLDVKASDGSYSFKLLGTYSSSTGMIESDGEIAGSAKGSACIWGDSEFSQGGGNPFDAQALGIDIVAYQYDKDGKIIAAFRGSGGDDMGDIPEVDSLESAEVNTAFIEDP